jgi:hypothetical protein
MGEFFLKIKSTEQLDTYNTGISIGRAIESITPSERRKHYEYSVHPLTIR